MKGSDCDLVDQQTEARARQMVTISEYRYRWLRLPATTFVITHSPSRSKRPDGRGFSPAGGQVGRLRSGLPNGIEAPRSMKMVSAVHEHTASGAYSSIHAAVHPLSIGRRSQAEVVLRLQPNPAGIRARQPSRTTMPGLGSAAPVRGYDSDGSHRTCFASSRSDRDERPRSRNWRRRAPT